MSHDVYYIFINGAQGVGKTTIQRMLKKLWRNHISRETTLMSEEMSRPLKEMTYAFLGRELTDHLDDYLEKHKDTPMGVLGGISYRDFQIELFHFLSGRMGEGVLATALNQRVFAARMNANNPIVVCCQVGILPELIAVINKVNINKIAVINVTREGYPDKDYRRNFTKNDLEPYGINQLYSIKNNNTLEALERTCVLRFREIMTKFNLPVIRGTVL